MTVPHWLQAYATTTGTDPHLVGTRAVPRHCRHCRHLTLAGYDAPLLAALAITDPHPLTPQLETACVILARPTWRLWGLPGRFELTPRHQPGLRADTTRTSATTCLVLAAHVCGQPLSHTPLPLTAPPVALPTDGNPPF